MGRIKELLILDLALPLADLVLHTNMPKWYHRISRMLNWTPSQIEAWQGEKLRMLIEDAYRYSPYYHQLFDSLSLTPADIQTVKDLEKIPTLTKEIIREHFDEIALRGKKGIHSYQSSSGGSTGNPTKYIKDKNSWGFINAFSVLMWNQVGFHYGDRFLALGSASLLPAQKRSVMHDLFYRMKGKTPVNAMNMTPEVAEKCLRLIREKHIHYIYGYASSLFLLAKYIEEKHLESSIDIHACVPTSEVLTDVYRSTLERVFKCPVLDMYGAHDGGMIAYETNGGYKVGYNCIVQTEDSSETSPAYLTDLMSNAFPFIRYELGDELELGEGYNTFFNGQVLNRVVGRTSDVIRLENGHVLTGPGFTVLFGELPIKGYRLFKSGPLQITVEVVKDEGFCERDEELIRGTMHKHAGDDCEIIINYPEKVQTRKNGKNLFFLNN